LYWSDTKAHAIYAFDFDVATGTLSRRRVFATFALKQAGQDLDAYGGRPDGAAVDAEGCYWVALFEGQRLLRLSPAGELLREVILPVRCPTMPCFGDADLRTLYVTTSRENRPAAELDAQPHAGCVLSLRVDVPGLPVHMAPERGPGIVRCRDVGDEVHGTGRSLPAPACCGVVARVCTYIIPRLCRNRL
jgi:sugar lactone lactonase YvrE